MRGCGCVGLQGIPVNVTAAAIVSLGPTAGASPRGRAGRGAGDGQQPAGAASPVPVLVLGTNDRVLHVFQAVAVQADLSHARSSMARPGGRVKGGVGGVDGGSGRRWSLRSNWERNLPGQVRSISTVTEPGRGAVLLVGLSTGLFVTVDSTKRVTRWVVGGGWC